MTSASASFVDVLSGLTTKMVGDGLTLRGHADAEPGTRAKDPVNPGSKRTQKEQKDAGDTSEAHRYAACTRSSLRTTARSG